MGNFIRVVLAGLLVSLGCVAFAQDTKAMAGKGEDTQMMSKKSQPAGEMDNEDDMDMDEMPMGAMMGRRHMTDKGKSWKEMMMGKGMMMGRASLVATSDGGIVVLMGNTLQKYDKNLTLKKEVEIKIDKGAMHPMWMKDKREGCVYDKR